jgi:hypothetical protein
VEAPVSREGRNAYPVDCHALDDGTLVVTDSFSRQVLLVGALGDLRGTLKGFEFESPFGVTSLDDGLVLVSDSELGLAAIFSREGDFVGTFGEGILEMPTFLDGTRGLVCVSDPGKMSIEVFRVERLQCE